MRTLIWKEMYYAKKNEEFISIYISLLRTTRKFIDLSTYFFTATGIIAWFSENKENKFYIGLSLALLAFIQIVDIIQTKFVASDEYIDDVRELKTNWIMYFDKLEKIWFDINIKKIENSIIVDSFLEIKPMKQSIEELDSDIKLWQIPFITKKANILTTNFMKRYYE